MQAHSRPAYRTLGRNGGVSMVRQTLTFLWERVLFILVNSRKSVLTSAQSRFILFPSTTHLCPPSLPPGIGKPPISSTYSGAGRGSRAATRLQASKKTSTQPAARVQVHRTERSQSSLLSPSTSGGFPCRELSYPVQRKTGMTLRKVQMHTNRASKSL